MGGSDWGWIQALQAAMGSMSWRGFVPGLGRDASSRQNGARQWLGRNVKVLPARNKDDFEGANFSSVRAGQPRVQVTSVPLLTSRGAPPRQGNKKKDEKSHLCHLKHLCSVGLWSRKALKHGQHPRGSRWPRGPCS